MMYKVLIKTPWKNIVLFTLPMISYFFAIFIVIIA